MSVQTCHKQVMEVAKAACAEHYEALMGASNEIWLNWKAQNPNLSSSQLERKFVRTFWPRCIEFARGTLAHMLSLKTTSDEMKAQIYEVLLLDKSLLVGMPKQSAVEIVNRELLKKQEGRLH